MKERESVFRKLYQEHRQHWYLICLRYQKSSTFADDALQNGLIQIFKNYHQYDDSKGSFKSWSSKVMVNENLQLIRKNKSLFAFDELSNGMEICETGEGAIERMSMEELTLIIQKLPDGYRSVFNLYVIEGLSLIHI